MILLDENLHELGDIECDIDVEVGTSEDSTNDFELMSNVLSRQRLHYDNPRRTELALSVLRSGSDIQMAQSSPCLL